MKYRDILGFSKKQSKKKVVPEQPKPSVSDLLKEEFGDVELGKIYTDKDKPPFQVNEAKLSIGGVKFVVSINVKDGLVLNFIPTKMVDDKDKVWSILNKHLQKKLKFADFSEYRGISSGFSFKIDKYDVEDWLIKLIK